MPGQSDAAGTASNAGTDPRRLAAVRSYYDQTRLDYRWLWFARGDQSIHFGWWGNGVRNHRASLVAMNEALADRGAVTAGTRVLDAGCGVGSTSRWLAKHRGAAVVGITPVEGQVRRARELTARAGLEHLVTTQVGDYLATDFPDASFDVVLAQESVCHAADKAAFLREVARVLKPGGRLVVAEYFLFPRPYAAGEQALLERWWSGWAIPDLAVGPEFEQWARDAGLPDARLDDVTPFVERSLRRLHRITVTFYLGELLLRRLRIRSEVQHGNVRASREHWRALRRGLWYYGILTATKGD